MKTYNTQKEFLKDCIDNTFEIKDDIELKFDLYYQELNIKCLNLKALNIDANNISAYNIEAMNIKAFNINAYNIDASNIKANDISYYAVCFAYYDITCNSIKGTRNNAKHFCLDGNLTINGVKRNENNKRIN